MAVCQTHSLMARSLWRIGKLQIKRFAFSLSFTDELVLALAGSAPWPFCVAFLCFSPSALHPNRPMSSRLALLCVNTIPDLCQDGRAVWSEVWSLASTWELLNMVSCPRNEQAATTQADGQEQGKGAASCCRGWLDLLGPSVVVLHSWFYFIAWTLQGAAGCCKRFL